VNTPASGAVPPSPNTAQLALQSVYLKDCSFESPLGPRIEAGSPPQVNLDLNTTSSVLADDVREVLLTVTVSAKHDDKTLFVVEVKQAGAFLMRNLSEDERKRAIASLCPTVLFPYARAVVSSLVTQGGFPQFLLPPVNFDAIYERTIAEGSTATKN
jgi:preprotein translocase subunit SecB